MTFRWAATIVFVLGVAAAVVGIDVRASYGAHVTADEPQYLLTALSLAEDRSLDISDEIAQERYTPFHEIELNRQTEPLPDGSEISPHDPLLPIFLAAPMDLGGFRAAKGALATINGVLGVLILWLSVRRFEVTETRATPVVGVFIASAPFAVYGQQVYPELPAAAVVAVAAIALTGRISPASLVVVAAAVTALPWLSIKYAPVAAALAIVALWRMRDRARVRQALAFMGGLAVMGAVYLFAHRWLYGGWTVYATGDHFQATGEFSVVGTNIDPVGRSRRLIGLMIDDKFGLAAWQPAFLAAFPAVGALVARRPQGWPVLSVPFVAGWLNATFVALTMQGWWWPGRQVVVVLPLLVVAIAWWAGLSRGRTIATTVAGIVGVFSYLWLVAEGLQGSLTWVVDFYETSDPFYRVWQSVLPDYLDVSGATWALQAVWLVVAASAMWWGSRPSRRHSTTNSVTIPSS